MIQPYLFFLCICLYLLASVVICYGAMKTQKSTESRVNKYLFFAHYIVMLACLLHCYIATLLIWIPAQGINVGASAMLVLISALILLLFFIACIFMPLMKLGVLLFPSAAFCLSLAMIWQSDVQQVSHFSYSGILHIFTAVFALAFLCLSWLQSLLYYYQNSAIKNHSLVPALRVLPPLQTMEKLIFQLAWCGFLLLSLTLANGLIFNHAMFAQNISFNHHIVITSIAWICFALFLFQRHVSGLRGERAVIWLSVSYFILLLGYFGTKLILESM